MDTNVTRSRLAETVLRFLREERGEAPDDIAFVLAVPVERTSQAFATCTPFGD